MAAKTFDVYEFQIILKGTTPKIWRRIQVPEYYNFWDFHIAIQHAMGWKSTIWNYHLHQFEMINPKTSKKVSIGIPDEEWTFGEKVYDEEKLKISQCFSLSNKKADYEYDFGDGWQHEILLEKILPAVVNAKYPQCIAGERECPPEDCGGVYGYEELLEILANPKHEEYKERKSWLKRIGVNEVKPENFDPK